MSAVRDKARVVSGKRRQCSEILRRAVDTRLSQPSSTTKNNGQPRDSRGTYIFCERADKNDPAAADILHIFCLRYIATVTSAADDFSYQLHCLLCCLPTQQSLCLCPALTFAASSNNGPLPKNLQSGKPILEAAVKPWTNDALETDYAPNVALVAPSNCEKSSKYSVATSANALEQRRMRKRRSEENGVSVKQRESPWDSGSESMDGFQAPLSDISEGSHFLLEASSAKTSKLRRTRSLSLTSIGRIHREATEVRRLRRSHSVPHLSLVSRSASLSGFTSHRSGHAQISKAMQAALAAQRFTKRRALYSNYHKISLIIDA
ncbi:hypothetical protein Ciccas_004784 [Cichlidogyrus casuarinus]|uniref:Uncharacterized protein n=1 Tax=Cichlidogyrus casuarinus TaxID=1844966 RepID=A0ABD2QAL0_9PLAT